MNLAESARRFSLATLLFRLLLLSLALPALASANAGGEALACRDESALSRAAAELLLSRSWTSSEAVSSSVRAAGSDVVMVRGYYAGASAADAATFLAEFERGADAPTVCGVAHGVNERLLLVAARGGSLGPLTPRSTQIQGRLSAGFSHPELVVADARGALTRLPVDDDSLVRGVSIPEQVARPARVQLLARGPQGLRPIAERVLPAAGELAAKYAAPAGRVVAPPRPGDAVASASSVTGSSPQAEAAESEPPDQLELSRALSARLTRLRASQGRRSLRANALLDRVAAEQAEAVCASGRIGHEPEPGQDPQARLRRSGVEARRVGETVARAEDATAAFAAFERSPAHRLSLLEPAFTDAGYGQASDRRGRVCVVILLAAWPRYVGR
jgi:uncharacterized protein YkwD